MGFAEKKHFVLINDTVATLLGGKCYGSFTDTSNEYIGYIFGYIFCTGTNACYVERLKRISELKSSEYTDEKTIVNLESGMYSGFMKDFEDKRVDGATMLPGDHIFERMVSGAYLTNVIMETAKAVSKGGLIPRELASRLKEREITLKDIDEFCYGEKSVAMENILQGYDEKRETLIAVFNLLYKRAAKLIAITFGALVECSKGEKATSTQVCICVEGTTFHKSRVLRAHLEQYIKEHIEEKPGLRVHIVKVNNATLIGTAAAGLLNLQL